MWAMKIFWQMTQAIFVNLQDILMFWASINMKYLYHILQMEMGNLREQIYIIYRFAHIYLIIARKVFKAARDKIFLFNLDIY